MKKHWPKSYLNTFTAFNKDLKSKRHLEFHVDRFFGNYDSVDKHKPIEILDVCCGTGHAGLIIKEHIKKMGYKCNVTYFDKSAEILDAVNVKEGDKTIAGNVFEMGCIANQSFDIVVSRYGFNNLSQQNWAQSLQECLRVLKSKGVFLLQDHFVPGKYFSQLVNDAEQHLAQVENKPEVPYIYSTDDFNDLLDQNPDIESRVKSGYGLIINIWERLLSKKDIIDFDFAKKSILDFYKKVCMDKYQLAIVDEEEYIHVYNVTYAIVKK